MCGDIIITQLSKQGNRCKCKKGLGYLWVIAELKIFKFLHNIINEL